jgi:hypothetical protein
MLQPAFPMQLTWFWAGQVRQMSSPGAYEASGYGGLMSRALQIGAVDSKDIRIREDL